MGKPRNFQRLFVAVYPPDDVTVALSKAAVHLAKKFPNIRPVTPKNIHLTVVFLGDQPVSKIGFVVESVERAASGVRGFALKPSAVVALPENGPKRILAVTTDAPSQLLEVRSRLVRRFARDGSRIRPNDRFLPHLTIGRCSPPGGTVRLDGVEFPSASFPVDRLYLMRSILSHAGAEHREVASVRLG